MSKTIVFQVFDWEKLGKAECMGEVRAMLIVCLALNRYLSFDKVQIPLWQLNHHVETDAWKDLHKMTGTKDKVMPTH